MRQPTRDSGFTLIEIMVVVALISVMATIGVGSWRAWASASGQKGAAVDLQTVLRQTQERAITEGRDFCVEFGTAPSTYTIYRGACGGEKVNGPFELPADVYFENVMFTRPDGTTSSSQLTFRASGRAWPGGLTIKRTGSSKPYVLDVEGLTGRVSIP